MSREQSSFVSGASFVCGVHILQHCLWAEERGRRCFSGRGKNGYAAHHSLKLSRERSQFFESIIVVHIGPAHWAHHGRGCVLHSDYSLQVEEAAKLANAHDFILSFPLGYRTMVGERGLLFSQCIRMARHALEQLLGSTAEEIDS